jgi:hypothetical protein
MNIQQYPNQDPNTIITYEIIGTYFIDIIFNHIYINAKLKLTSGQSLVDEYIRRLQLYIIGVKNDKSCYNNTVKELHKYYITATNSCINFNEFIDTIVQTCTIDSMHKLSEIHKQEIVNNIICDLISNLVVYVSKDAELINKITIDHKKYSTEIIQHLQDQAVTILINKKLNIMNKFLKESGQIKDDNVSVDIINELKKTIRKLINEKNELIEINMSLEETITNLNNKITILSAKNSYMSETEYKLRKLIKLLSQKEKSIFKPADNSSSSSNANINTSHYKGGTATTDTTPTYTTDTTPTYTTPTDTTDTTYTTYTTPTDTTDTTDTQKQFNIFINNKNESVDPDDSAESTESAESRSESGESVVSGESEESASSKNSESISSEDD